MPDKPRILLLGDSIRLSYQPHVVELLRDRAEVVGPADNCRFSLYTAMRINAWIEELGKPQIIHWNNGIWDCGHNTLRGPSQFAIPDYLINLRTILGTLRTHTDRIIWATITPVHPRIPFGGDRQWNWRNTEIDAYNAAALEYMVSQGVAINDLNAVVKADYDGNLSDDMLHLSQTGEKRCAAAVASALDKVISEVSV